MNKILVVYNENTKKNHKILLESLMQHPVWGNCVIDTLMLQENTCTVKGQADLCGSNADIIISMDMEGFQYKTLLENFQYNILSAKQLHLIITKEKWEKFKDAEFAMNLFVYAPVGILEKQEVETIIKDGETPNRRFYSEALLETPEQMIDFIVTDFLEAVQ